MHRSRLKNKYIRKRNDKNWENYKKQRNFCVDLLRKTEAEYFRNLNVKDLSDNRKFLKTIKPYFSNKDLNSKRLSLQEKGNLVADEKKLATIMSNFFINVTKDLKLKIVRVNLIIWKILLKHFNLTQTLKKPKKLSILLKSSLFVM